MKKFIDTYLSIIFEDSILAQEYHNVWIEISNKTEMEHFNKRANNPKRSTYDIDSILLIIKRGIDKFLTDKKYLKYRNDKENANNFSIISKSYPDVKVKVLIWYNSKKRRIKAIENGQPPVQYMCTLKTILNKDMKDYEGDIPIIVENINSEEIEIYVE